MNPSFRASELDRILSCNGSITLVPLVAPRDGGEGDEGSSIHHAIAERAIRELGATPPEGGLPAPTVPAGYVLPANATWIVEWAIRHIRETVPADWSLMVEVPFSNDHPKWTNTGHADLVAISPDGTEAIGIDWKTGRDPVDPAHNNWQVFDYQCLIKAEWPSVRSCKFQIAQPRVTEEDDVERVSTSALKGEALEMANATLNTHVEKAVANPRELNSGLKQCKWCPVGLQCKALQIELETMKASLSDEDIARIKRTPDDPVLADWIISARTLARPIKDAEDLLHKRLDEVGVVTSSEGVTVTRKVQRGSYSVADPVKFMAACSVLLPERDSIARTWTPSMTRIKDEIAEKQGVPKSGKAPITAESIFDAHLRPLVEQGERKILQFT